MTPRASSTSALPERLEIERLPCLATGIPAAAATRAVAVEILKVDRPPPVPQVSMSSAVTWGRSSTQFARMALAKADSSSRLVPFMSRPTWNPAICTSLIWLRLIAAMREKISSSVSFWPVVILVMICLYIVGTSLTDVF